MTKTTFDWDAANAHATALREMGCAVLFYAPEDLQTLTADDDDLPTISDDDARAWMNKHQGDVECAIQGDYWGDTLRDLLDRFPLTDARGSGAVTINITDELRARHGVALLARARELFKAADNRRTVARVRSAISSAKGAVRIQASRRVRAA